MRIVLITNDDFSMWHFWRGLIRTLKARSVDVLVVTPDGPFVPALLGIGARHRAVRLKRFMSPWSDMWFCVGLYRLFKAEQVDLVCNITVKPNVYGAIVGKLAGVQRIVGMVEGLGYGFNEGRAWQGKVRAVSYTHLRAHETVLDLVCRLLLAKKKQHCYHGPSTQ